MGLWPVTETDQVVRKQQFLAAHPDVVIFSAGKAGGFWTADWTDPRDGSERRTVQSDLKRVLDVLDESFV